MGTKDLGDGWFAASHFDGFTLRNPEKGQRIDLTNEQAGRFADLYATFKEEQRTDDAAHRERIRNGTFGRADPYERD